MLPSCQKKMDKLNSDLSSLLKKLARYSDDQLNAKPAKEVWSVLQVLHHLMLAEELTLKYLNKKMSFNPTLKKAGFLVKFRRFMLEIILLLPFKLKAPKAVGEENFPAFSSLKEVDKKWRRLRQGLADFLDIHSENLQGKIVYRHPRSGAMTLNDLLVFYDIHFIRHRKQIEKVLKTQVQ